MTREVRVVLLVIAAALLAAAALAVAGWALDEANPAALALAAAALWVVAQL